MDDATPATDQKLSDEETSAKPGAADPNALARRWTTELKASAKWMEKFHRTAKACEKAYLDMVDDGAGARLQYAGKTNLFWSNVQVILSAIYGRLPKATVKRKFDDPDDDVSRVAALIMQRILNGDMEREWDDTNAAMRDAVADRFISGLGQVWCRYDCDIETTQVSAPPDPMTGQPAIDPTTGQPKTVPQESIANEEADVDYVNWQDFRYSPCRRWRECRWVARRVYMGKARLMSRFKLTESQVAQVPMKQRTPDTSVTSGDSDDVLKATPFAQAAVWEIWCREHNYVVWMVEGMSQVLDTQDDPLQLDDFFPCPQPVVATTLTSSFLPRADYALAQDLYKELDRINAKLSKLTEAVKAAGVYDKNAASLSRLFGRHFENDLLPVENWSNFVEKGGMKGVVDWMPIEAFVNAINQLSTRKSQLQQDLYEVLGISDIMRGASVASETATAQTLKVQYGGARLTNLQNEVARFVSETMRIRANIIANIWDEATLRKRSLIDRTPDAEFAGPAIAMLKDFGTSLFSIEVSADTLAAPDWAAEKEARTEFLGAASNYIMAAGPMVQQSPMVGSFLIKLLQWAAAGFKGAQSIEGVLDQAAKALEKQAEAPPPPPPPPSPEDQKNLALAGKAKSDAGKADAEATRTTKEAALLPPVNLQAGEAAQPHLPIPGIPNPFNIGQPGGLGGGGGGGAAGGMPPGGPQPFGPGGAGHAALGAAPGTVAPMLPESPMPTNPMTPGGLQ